MKLLTLNLKVNRSIIACPKHSFFPWIGWRIYSNFPCLWCQLHSSKNQHVDRRKRNSHFSATGSSRIHSHQFTAKSGNIALSSVDDQSDLGLRIVVALLILIMHGQCFDHEILCHQNGSNIRLLNCGLFTYEIISCLAIYNTFKFSVALHPQRP